MITFDELSELRKELLNPEKEPIVRLDSGAGTRMDDYGSLSAQ